MIEEKSVLEFRVGIGGGSLGCGWAEEHFLMLRIKKKKKTGEDSSLPVLGWLFGKILYCIFCPCLHFFSHLLNG
jgi:hypothetical protein